MFGKSTNNTVDSRLFGYQVTTSLYGRPIAICYGRCRVSGNVIWTGGWTATPVSGGKGNKGKGGTQQYNYMTSLFIALGQGVVQGVYSIWRDKDKFNLAISHETYVVPGGGGTYKSYYGGVGKPYWWVLNVAVARQDTIAYSVTDYGSPGSVSASNLVWTPMKLVPSSPGAGEYTLSGVGGPSGDGYARYGFSAADAGKVMRITRSEERR